MPKKQKKIIKVDAAKLARWWLCLNEWEVPLGLDLGSRKDAIRGAWEVVNKLLGNISVQKIEELARGSKSSSKTNY